MPSKTKQKAAGSSAHIYLIIVLLLALALRLIYFFGILEGDDADYVYYAHYLADHGLRGLSELDSLITGSNRPGQYIPTAIAFKLFGVSEFTAALFPLAASLLTCYFIYRIGKLLIDEQAGLLAAFLWAVFPLNIFLATQLDPEGPLTMATTGAMLCLFTSAIKPTWRQRLPYYAASLLLVAWAFLIKQSSLPIIFVIAAWLYWTYLRTPVMRAALLKRIPKPRQRQGLIALAAVFMLLAGVYLYKQPWARSINSAELTATDVADVFLMGRMNPVRWNELGNMYYFNLNREIYDPVPVANNLASYPRDLQFVFFDAFVPLTLLGAAYLTVKKREEAKFALLWLLIVLFYIEWGPYPRSVKQTWIYLPVSHWISPDNLLYVCVPLLLVTGAFLASRMSTAQARTTILWAAPITLLASALLESGPGSQFTTGLISLSLLTLSMLALIGLPFLTNLNIAPAKEALLYSGLTILVGIAALNHGLHYHVSFFTLFRERRENLKMANAYLAGQPPYPILNSGLSGWLDMYAGYPYGFARFETEYSYPATRLTSSMQQIEQYGGYALSEGCSEPAAGFAAWPVAEFGDPTSEMCVSLARWLPAADLEPALLAATQTAHAQPTLENLSEQVAIAANARDLAAFIRSLSEIATRFPDSMPIIQASGVLLAEAPAQAANQTYDLLAAYKDGESNWELGRRLDPFWINEGSSEFVEFRIARSTQDEQPITLPLQLKPGTAYILDIEYSSFAPSDFVRFPELTIPDSHPDGWSRQPEWTPTQIVFITPAFAHNPEPVLLELARVYDRGEIRFRKIDLIEVVPDAQN